FSSRRRHTRSKRDWSSDVCSSDLVDVGIELAGNPINAHIVRLENGTDLVILLLHNRIEHVIVTSGTSQRDAEERLGGMLDRLLRSEERRVGKECRSRMGAALYNRV